MVAENDLPVYTETMFYVALDDTKLKLGITESFLEWIHNNEVYPAHIFYSGLGRYMALFEYKDKEAIDNFLTDYMAKNYSQKLREKFGSQE